MKFSICHGVASANNRRALWYVYHGVRFQHWDCWHYTKLGAMLCARRKTKRANSAQYRIYTGFYNKGKHWYVYQDNEYKGAYYTKLGAALHIHFTLKRCNP
jgi:hypothetical protein